MPEKKLINGYPFIAYHTEIFDASVIQQRAHSFYEWMTLRRSCRDFSDRPVPREVIDDIIMTASTAPSGAHKQPWTFCVVTNPEIKKAIRLAAEQEEYENYHHRMNKEWLEDLAPIGTAWEKPFLETAPFLVVVFRRSFERDADGTKHQNYYVNESVGLACGFLLAAVHHAGLVALTHTPSPMNFLSVILGRPENEKPFLLIPIGYPAEECWVPDLARKELEKVAVYFQ